MVKQLKVVESRESIFRLWNEHTRAEDLYSKLFEQHPLLDKPVESLLKGTAFVVFNHVNNTWEYVSKELAELTGYTAEMHEKEGFNYSFKYNHPDYTDFAFQGSHRVVFDYLYSIPAEERKHVSFTKDWLYLVHEKEYVRAFQKGMVLEMNEQGGIVRTLHVISLISHLKKENFATLIIKSADNQFTIYNYCCQKKTITNLGYLSKREKEILDFLARGYSTKRMAETLFLSEHTVNTHRRNLLNKTNCVDTTALVTYAKMIGIIV